MDQKNRLKILKNSYHYFNTKITIHHASVTEKEKIFNWLCCSDTTELHLGGLNFPQCPVPSWKEFLTEFEEYYFLEQGRDKASIMIIKNNNNEIGCVCYKMFYLKESCAELSIWLNSKNYVGKGYGPETLKKVILYLNKNFLIKKFLIRPSKKNLFAIKAYQKVGFEIVSEEKKDFVIKEFIKEEFLGQYYEGEYGFNDTVVMIKNVK